jgi:hypothetical protein
MLHSKIYSHAARRKPLVSIVNRAKCLWWATRIQNWNVYGHWGQIIFSEKSRFNLLFNDERVRCWRIFWRTERSCNIQHCGPLWQFVIDSNMDHMDQLKYINILDENSLPSVKICLVTCIYVIHIHGWQCSLSQSTHCWSMAWWEVP